MNTISTLLSRGFTPFFVGTSIAAILFLDYDSQRLTIWFLLPFYAICLLFQAVIPKVQQPLENGELTTDLISNVVMVLIGALQNGMMAALFALGSSSVLIQAGWMNPDWGLSNFPMWVQIPVGIVLLDFFFYITHRMAHEVPILWRFHSVHHCAHRVTLLNAYRVHPIDALFRRFVPLFLVLLTGLSESAVAATAVIGSVLATITHLNMDLKHGWINYVIGTNEVHRWHHSAKHDEAKNYAIIMLWDHLFGTFYLPKDRDLPERTGLSNESGYPLHSYWKQLIIPFRWNRLKEAEHNQHPIERKEEHATIPLAKAQEVFDGKQS